MTLYDELRDNGGVEIVTQVGDKLITSLRTLADAFSKEHPEEVISIYEWTIQGLQHTCVVREDFEPVNKPSNWFVTEVSNGHFSQRIKCTNVDYE